MISIGILSFVLVWWLQLIILYGNTFLPHFPAKMACKWAIYGKMGHYNDLARSFVPLRDGIDQNFTITSGLVAHICVDFLHENMCYASFDPLEYPKISYLEGIYDQSHVHTDFSVQYQPCAMVFITF